ncbi:protein toll [Caerostris extrusa]|uniref:Protein toll n=1 Tax=Caerostris extrusa TaxID=172846 RepID=A0AAV4S2W7_CAEEX|nr:protein toll [Caerostris extrusa]
MLKSVKKSLRGLPKYLELSMYSNSVHTTMSKTSLLYMMYHRQSQNSLKVGQIAHLSLAGNHIQNLSSEDFRELDEVRYLHLQNNFISTVERFTFTVIRYDLMFLDLSRNKIRSLQGCVRFLSVLNYLNLTDNRIESFEEGEFDGLNELTDLYLHGNRITTLGGEVQRLLQLQYLDISSNRIRTLRKEQILDKLKYLYLAGNPFSCDCKLLPFLSYLNSTNNLNSEVPCAPSKRYRPIPPHRTVHLGVAVSAPTTPRGTSCRWTAAP